MGEYSIGEMFAIGHLANQHDQNISLQEASKVIVVFDKPQYYDTNAFIEAHPKLFVKHRIAYINDISALPSTILKLFVKPSMKKKPFDILLLQDLKASQKLNYQEDKITLYTLKKRKIINIEYLDTQALERYFK